MSSVVKLALIFIAIAVACVAGFATSPHKSFEEPHSTIYHRTGVPRDSLWKLSSRADPNYVAQFSLALKQRNTQALIDKLYAVSNPGSLEYGKHLNKDQILNIVSPSQDVQNKVIGWLRASADDFIEIQNLRDVIVVTAPCAYIERLFKTEMHTFVHKKTGSQILKHLGPLSSPSRLNEHIEMVTGITELPPPNLLEKSKDEGKSKVSAKKPHEEMCNTAYTLKKLYNVSDTLRVTQKNASLSAYSQTSQKIGFGESELETYLTANGLEKNNVSCILGITNLYVKKNTGDGEAEMDIQLETGIATGARTCFWILPSHGGWMYEFTQLILATPDAPKVVSISYAWYENEQCDNGTIFFTGNCSALNIPNSQVYVNRTNIEFAKLGLMGITVISASGDDGTAGNHNSPDKCKTMEPVYPASSPFVLAVGATAVTAKSNKTLDLADAPEICTNKKYNCNCSTSLTEAPGTVKNEAEFDTGGGFSRWNEMPSYQESAVKSYLSSGVELPVETLWDKTKRGYPDVSAAGSDICVISTTNGLCDSSGGTSASSPILAAIVTLLNNDRLAANKTTLGFVNPLIYKLFSADPVKYFHNYFESGNNAGECSKTHGFNAKAGQWTPLTGVGSPNFGNIREFVSQLP